jgi:hypothetical protein
MPLAISPKLRAGLLLYHVVAVIVLALPRGSFSEARWQARGTRADIAEWDTKLKKIGLLSRDASFENHLRSAAKGYAKVRRTLTLPFEDYASVTGMRQGWAMFASPQRHPSELWIDMQVDGEWKPIYRPTGAALDDALHAFLKHNRLRKFQGRFARGFDRSTYEDFVTYLARRVFATHPEATAVTLRLYAYASPSPQAARADDPPQGKFEHERTFQRGDLTP